MPKSTSQAQLKFVYPDTHGGERPGAGRPRAKGNHPRHECRQGISRHTPAHVTLRLVAGLRRLRVKNAKQVICKALVGVTSREDFRVVLWSIQGNHIHLLVEGSDRKALGAGMGALNTRIAKGLNRLWGRRGQVFAGRYHSEVLTCPAQVRNAIKYVLGNFRKHAKQQGRTLPKRTMDEYSSWAWFTGWQSLPGWLKRLQAAELKLPPPCLPPKTWLLRVGWQRHGLIGPWEAPKFV